MKFLLLLITYCAFTVPVFSQKAVYNEKISYTYFDKDKTEIPSMEGAAYVRVFMGLDAIRAYYEVREYTIGGTLIFSICSSSREYLIPEGPCTWYNDKRKPSRKGQYENGRPAGQWTEFYYNGQIKEQYTYLKNGNPDEAGNIPYTIDNTWDSTGRAEVKDGNGLYQDWGYTTGVVLQKGMIKNGLKDGAWQGYYENGQKGYDEEYVNGKFLKGTRFSPGGEQIAYDKQFQLPVYPGGLDALSKFLSKHIKYPRSAQEKGVSGTVVVKFTVEADGSVTNVGIHAGVERSLNEEALRVMRLMPAWVPGKNRGMEAALPCQQPVRFSLQ